MSNLTQTPWRVEDGDIMQRVPVVVDRGGVMVARVPPGRPDAEAAALVMAAAPDLLEALGVAAEALALPTSPEGKERALAVVRAAIAKAEGRS